MDRKMFCFQCEQTAMCKGCTGMAGVCGKKADTAGLQDKLTGTMVALASAALKEPEKINPDMSKLIIKGLFTTITNVNFNNQTIGELTALVQAASETLETDVVPYDMNKVWDADEDIRSLKSLILFGIRGMAAYAYHAMVLGYRDDSVEAFPVQLSFSGLLIVYLSDGHSPQY